MKKILATAVLFACSFFLSSCNLCSDKSGSLSVLYMIIALISLLLLLGYAFFIKKKDKWFVLLFTSVFIVNTGYFLLSASANLEMALWANRISYFGSVFLPFAMFMIIINVCNFKLPKIAIWTMIGIGGVVFLVAASPGYLDIYYKSVEFAVENGTTVLVKEYGALHSLYLVYLVAYFLIMVSAITYATYKKNIESNKHAITLLCAVFVNICVWFVEQLFKFNFEFLSVSYIITELFLLGLYSVIEDINKSNVDLASEKPNYQNTDEIRELSNNLIKKVTLLTPTEKKIYDLYCEGRKTKEVTELLGIKETTLKFHNSNIYSKLGVKSKKQLLECALCLKQDNQ